MEKASSKRATNSDESIFARLLAEKGEGVHHIAARTPNFDETMAMQAKRGNELALSCTFSDIQIAYLPTDRDLGVIIEVFSGMPGTERKPRPRPRVRGRFPVARGESAGRGRGAKARQTRALQAAGPPRRFRSS